MFLKWKKNGGKVQKLSKSLLLNLEKIAFEHRKHGFWTNPGWFWTNLSAFEQRKLENPQDLFKNNRIRSKALKFVQKLSFLCSKDLKLV